jgi:hypothetical protein
MIAPLLVAALLLAAAGALAASLDVRVEAYRQAVAAGAVGTVAGRALAEDLHRRRASEQPLGEISVTLLPRSESLLVELHRIKDRARADLDAFRTSALAIADARRAYERALWEAGAPELVRFAAVAPDGRFVLEGVPAGSWLLVAQRAVYVAKGAAHGARRDREVFAPRLSLAGYYAVSVWLREIALAAGQWEAVELTDRNAWMTAIAEEREPGAGR